MVDSTSTCGRFYIAFLLGSTSTCSRFYLEMPQDAHVVQNQLCVIWKSGVTLEHKLNTKHFVDNNALSKNRMCGTLKTISCYCDLGRDRSPAARNLGISHLFVCSCLQNTRSKSRRRCFAPSTFCADPTLSDHLVAKKRGHTRLRSRCQECELLTKLGFSCRSA